MYAAFAAGADAVYAGGKVFSARAYAANFDDEDLLDTMDYAHLLGRKLYLTLNTLLTDAELKEALCFIKPLYEAGLDGVIVQDIGLISALRECFPKLPLHGSTQLSVANTHGAEYFKEKGLNRIVAARELSLKETERIIKETGVELEVFIHGAMCYSYSGYCLFSSFLGGRSGNRGRCAGPCRQPYSAGSYKDSYLLSMKDMCTLDILPQILKAGAASLKIEGRMKSPEYVYGVTRAYRHCLDGEKITGKALEEVVRLYSRGGLSHGYYERHNSPEMITYEKGAYHTDQAGIKLPEPLKVKLTGECNVMPGEKLSLTVSLRDSQISVQGDEVQKAQNRAMGGEEIEKRIKKTGDTFFEFEDLKVHTDGNAFVSVGVLNELRRRALAAIREEALSAYRRSC